MITSQLKGNIRLGAVVSLISYTAFWISLMNFVLISLVAYSGITIKALVAQFAPWFDFNFLWYIFFVGLIVIIIMIVEYKIVIPSRQRFASSQEYAHGSPIQKDFEIVKKDNEEMKEDIKLIKDKILGDIGDKYCHCCGLIMELPKIYECSGCGTKIEIGKGNKIIT